MRMPKTYSTRYWESVSHTASSTVMLVLIIPPLLDLAQALPKVPRRGGVVKPAADVQGWRWSRLDFHEQTFTHPQQVIERLGIDFRVTESMYHRISSRRSLAEAVKGGSTDYTLGNQLLH